MNTAEAYQTLQECLKQTLDPQLRKNGKVTQPSSTVN